MKRLRGILKWLVSADKKISSTEKLVLLTLLLYQNDEGECSPSVTEISTASSLNRATITRTLGKLEEKGAVIISPRYNKDGRKSNSYEIAHQPRPKGVVYAQRATMLGAQSDIGSRTKQHSEVPPIADFDELAREICEDIESGKI